MDSEIQQVKATVDSMKNLKIDKPAKERMGHTSGPKDGSTSDAMSCISSVDATSIIKESEVDQDAMMAGQGIYYPVDGLYGYYYPGYDSSLGEWDDRNYSMGSDVLDIQHSATQADNRSLVYYIPGFQPGYSPYSPYLPGALVGVDGQYLGQQLCYPSQMPSQALVSGFFPQSFPGLELVPAYPLETSPIFAGGTNGNGYSVDLTVSAPKLNFSSQSHTHASLITSPPSRSTNFEKKGSSPAFDSMQNSGNQNHSYKPINKASNVLSKGSLPINKLALYPNQGKGCFFNSNSPANIKESGQSWVGTEKLKARNKVHGLGDFDLLNEQNRGPRTNGSKNIWISGVDYIGSLGTEESDNISSTSVAVVRKDEYNLPDFPTKYDHALFFVIKSYSEDDIHKSIKYNVWASTPNGNKRLDNSFQVAQEKMAEKRSKCPVFLFFSVNASGQFCGVAEMIGQVDFNKNMDFWQQEKWTGYFPVKWHIIKDIPNPLFCHVILENNDNKPVTNSRDMQEVKFPQGIELLNIFKNYSSKTSILDDFGFYEKRQKAMRGRRMKPPTAKLEKLMLKTDEIAQVTEPGKPKPVDSSSLEPNEIAAAKIKEDPVEGANKE